MLLIRNVTELELQRPEESAFTRSLVLLQEAKRISRSAISACLALSFLVLTKKRSMVILSYDIISEYGAGSYVFSNIQSKTKLEV